MPVGERHRLPQAVPVLPDRLALGPAQAEVGGPARECAEGGQHELPGMTGPRHPGPAGQDLGQGHPDQERRQREGEEDAEKHERNPVGM